jgi:hypothetical protein
MNKCIIVKNSETINELEKALDKVNVKLGHVGEVIEYAERCGTAVLAKIKLPYFESDKPFDRDELSYKKSGYLDIILPYDCIEVQDETT